jgi:hypothetical protein
MMHDSRDIEATGKTIEHILPEITGTECHCGYFRAGRDAERRHICTAAPTSRSSS